MCSLVFFGSHFHSVLNQGWSSALKYNLPAYSGLHIWQKDRGRCNAYRQTRFGRVALGKRRIQSLVIGIAMTGSLVEVSSWSVLVHPFKIYTHIIPNPLSSKLSTGKGWKGSRAGLKLQLFPAHIPRCCQGTWRHALAWTGFGWPVCGMVKCCLLKCYWTVSMMHIYIEAVQYIQEQQSVVTNKSCVLLSIWSLTYDVSGKDKLSRSIPNICQASWTDMRHIIWGEHFQHVFTDTPSQTSLSNWKIEDVLSDDIISWRNY